MKYNLGLQLNLVYCAWHIDEVDMMDLCRLPCKNPINSSDKWCMKNLRSETLNFELTRFILAIKDLCLENKSKLHEKRK